MLMRSFLPNPLELLKMWEKVSIMATLSTYDTWLIGSELRIPWGSRVVVPLLLLRRGCRKLVPIRSILLWGVILLVPIISSSISLVFVFGSINLIASLLIL